LQDFRTTIDDGKSPEANAEGTTTSALWTLTFDNYDAIF